MSGADLGRRAVIAGAATLPLAPRSGTGAEEAPDALAFGALEREFRRLHAEAERTRDDDAADALCARAQVIEELVLGTPAMSAGALMVKLGIMLQWADHSAPELKPGLREVLVHLGGTPLARRRGDGRSLPGA